MQSVLGKKPVAVAVAYLILSDLDVEIVTCVDVELLFLERV